jgi:predicted outer membrane repeat protein
MSTRSIRRASSRQRRSALPGKAAAAAGTAIGATILFAPAAKAATFEVENLEDDGAGSLRQAIEDANVDATADDVVFQSGLTGTITLTSGEIAIDEPVDIQGPGADVITVDGDDNQIFDADGDAGQSLRIGGLTLTGGRGSNAGALRVDDFDLTIADSVFTGNYSESRGGAFYSDLGTVEVTNTLFSNNVADEDGGAVGIFNTAGEPTDVVISDSVFTGNSTNGQGGGLYLASLDGAARVERSTFVGNSADEEGGGIYFQEPSDGDDSVLDSVTIAGNTAGGPGGGLRFDDTGEEAVAILQNSTVSGNTSGESGGGVAIDADEPSAEDVEILNSTIVQNAADGIGGGVYRGSYEDGGQIGSDSVAISSTIVANNTAAAGSDIGEDPGIETTDSAFRIGFSLIEGGPTATVVEEPGTNIFGEDPLLAALANNGGSTQTHAPATNSPAVDKGIANGLGTDQRGVARPQELSVANPGGGDGTDIGSVELRAADCRGASVARVDGTEANDTLTGTTAREAFFGLGGKDTVRAGGGGDCASGDAGRDRLSGGGGKDQLKGGGGKDRITGGGGKDRLKGGPGKDRLKGGGGKDRFNCGGGKDRVTAQAKDKVSASCEKVVERG